MYKVNVAISWVHEFTTTGSGAAEVHVESYAPGDTASLVGWPESDLIRFLQEGVIEPLPDKVASKGKPAATDKKDGE